MQRTIAALALTIAAAAAFPALAANENEGRIGPSLRILNNGRHLTPYGRLVNVGNVPTGGALTPDGRFYWTVSAGSGFNDIRIVSVKTAKVVQTIPLPGASGGVVIDLTTFAVARSTTLTVPVVSLLTSARRPSGRTVAA